MTLGLGITIGLFIIFLAVLIGPFKMRIIEHNLEAFLFVCGVLAMTTSGFVKLPGTETGWRLGIIEEALTAPLKITEVYGIPIGIVQIVLVFGLIIYKWNSPIHEADRKSVV
jgi:predicted cation transporter